MKMKWRKMREKYSKWSLEVSILLILILLLVLLIVGIGATILLVGLPAKHKHPTMSDFTNTIRNVIYVIAAVGGAVGLAVTYRRQHVTEEQHKLVQNQDFTVRFGAATGQLGHESAAVRLAGVVALAHLADEFESNRQMCINVLCAYMRMPYDPQSDRAIKDGEREVRLTIISEIVRRLQNNSIISWSQYNFNFNSVSFDQADFSGAIFPDQADFSEAIFFDMANFTGVRFSGGAYFFKTTFSGGAYFTRATFSGGANFSEATFSGGAYFAGATFSVGANFSEATFSGGANFTGVRFSGGNMDFRKAIYNKATIYLGEVKRSRNAVFDLREPQGDFEHLVQLPDPLPDWFLL